MTSDTGVANIIPSTPKRYVINSIIGNKINNCLANDKNAPVFAFPIAGKNVVIKIVIPFIIVNNMKYRK